MTAFVRGEQMVEIAAMDRTTDNTLRLYLFSFETACNASTNGCNHFDLQSPHVESGFVAWTLYEDIDIAATTVNCQSCHQFDGGPKHLLMQQATYPWRGWMFSNISDSDHNVLENAFFLAHTNEAYGGVPAANILPPGAYGNGGPETFEGFVENNDVSGLNSPFYFDSIKVATDIVTAYPGKTPDMNDPPSASVTWQGYYDSAKGGQRIPPSYVDFTAASFPKMKTVAASYVSAIAGTLPPDQMPDMGDVLLDAARPLLVLAPQPGLSGRGILTQVCSRCHNSRQDPTLPQSRFKIDALDTLPRAEKDLAIHRISLPPSLAHHMPPQRFTDLSDADKTLVIAELQK